MTTYLDPTIDRLEAALTGGNGPMPSASEIVAIGGV
jgi:hypothetical protein